MASEKVISYFRTEMRSTAEFHGRDGDIAEGMVDEDVEIPDVTEKGKLITLTTDEAFKYNIADSTAGSIEEVLAMFDLEEAEVVYHKETWAEEIVRVLTDPFVSSLLASIGFLGLMYEVMTAGWGVGGTIGVIALSLFLWGHYIVNLADMVDILILVVGVILLIIEAFFIPGFGFFGVAGILLIAAGMFMSLIGHWPTVDTPDLQNALFQVSVSFIITFVVAIAMFKIVPKTGVWRRIALGEETRADQGYVGTITDLDYLVGKIGKTLTLLHPTGTVFVGSERLDVVSEGGFIDKNTEVKIIKIEGNRIIVRETETT